LTFRLIVVSMHTSLWYNILSDLSLLVDSTTFETWFRSLQPNQIKDGTILVVVAPNSFSVDFIEQHYKSRLLSLAQKHHPNIKDILFILSPDIDINATITSYPPPEIGAITKQLHSSPLFNHNFTFDSFVVGSGNEFAKSAALAVAKSPGKTKFNPLLIYGGVGLGKTHLLQSIGNFLLSQQSGAQIAYSSSEEFYFNFIDAIKNNSTRKFSDAFKSSSVLLIDDIQFLSGKESTQEEFFYIFNTLYQNQRQIVLTSDLPPNELMGLQDRLISRFHWGLCVDIQPPNLETRVAILKKKAEQDNLNIPENILVFIAENVASNIRELEGIIIRLLAYSSITKRDITIDLVKSILKGNQKNEKTRFSIEKIIEKVADFYKVPVNNIREKNRRKEVAFCRQLAMYVVKLYTNYSLKSIGLHFGGRDHSTVIHAIQHIEYLLKTDKTVSSDIEKIVSFLSNET
jgi:chromosomal replication initiator protein